MDHLQWPFTVALTKKQQQEPDGLGLLWPTTGLRVTVIFTEEKK